MGMILQPPSRVRERVLLYGPPGAGKSLSVKAIAKRITPNKIYVLDSDMAWDRMLDADDPGNVEVFPTYDWADYDSNLKKVQSAAQRDDWIVVDMIGPAWDAVQAHFVEQVFHQDIAEYFLQARKQLKGSANLGALAGWTDWPVINAMYRGWSNRLIQRSNCHVLAITKADKVNADTDSKDIKQLFGGFAAGKPSGQKHLAHLFHTVMLMQKAGQDRWVMSTAKDREREMVLDKGVSDFALQYLVQVAKWRPGNGNGNGNG